MRMVVKVKNQRTKKTVPDQLLAVPVGGAEPAAGMRSARLERLLRLGDRAEAAKKMKETGYLEPSPRLLVADEHHLTTVALDELKP